MLPSVSFIRDEVEIILPEGYEVYYLPIAMELTTPFGDFRSAYRHEGGTIYYQGEKTRKSTSIPLKAYPNYRTFCQEMERGTAEWGSGSYTIRTAEANLAPQVADDVGLLGSATRLSPVPLSALRYSGKMAMPGGRAKESTMSDPQVMWVPQRDGSCRNWR